MNRTNFKPKNELDLLFNEFLVEGRIKGNATLTETYYQDCYLKFARLFKSVQTASHVNKVTYNRYITILQGENLRPSTIATYTRGIRIFFNWLIKNNKVEPFEMIKPKAEKLIKNTYTDDELFKLLRKPTEKEIKNNFADYRTWAIVNYLLSTGNRASTVCNLKVNDFDLYSGYVTLRVTKSKRQQIIPLTDEIISVLSEYITRAKLKGDDYIFPNVYGEKLTNGAIRQSIERYNLKRGVERKGVHLFRHTFAKKYILNGGDIFTLQKMMGHSDLEILREYVEMFKDDVRISNDKYNPLSSLVKGEPDKPKRKKIKL